MPSNIIDIIKSNIPHINSHLMLMILPVPSMMVIGSCRRSVEHCRSNSTRRDSAPGIRTCPVWQASSIYKRKVVFLHRIRKFSKEKFSKLLSLRTFFQNFFHFQSPQKTVFSKVTKKVIKRKILNVSEIFSIVEIKLCWKEKAMFYE